MSSGLSRKQDTDYFKEVYRAPIYILKNVMWIRQLDLCAMDFLTLK